MIITKNTKTNRKINLKKQEALKNNKNIFKRKIKLMIGSIKTKKNKKKKNKMQMEMSLNLISKNKFNLLKILNLLHKS